MTACAESRSRSGGGKFILIMIILAAISILLVQATVAFDESHAIERHGDDAIAIRECLEKNGPVQQWDRKSDGNIALICQMNDGRMGVQILKEDPINKVFKEITAFKNKSKTMDAISRYLGNRGYEPSRINIWGRWITQ